MKLLKIIGIMLITSNIFAQNTPFNEPPKWAQKAIWYQILPERFRNGDNSNNPQTKWMQNTWPFTYKENWQITKWTSDWYEGSQNMKDFYHEISARRYGGDLQGILNKLDYIQNLGINAIYFNPLNDAASHHKYDARNYQHIDINFGPDPQGDAKIIAQEIPENPSTWKWTSADKLFLKVIDECHKRNIKVVMDYSWNHIGADSPIWKDVVKNQENSKYKNWFEIESFKNDLTKTDFKYKGWAGVKELPELKKINVIDRKISPAGGYSYDGNIQDDAKKYIFEVSKRWLKPEIDGKLFDGIDGFRLDVADQIGFSFWKDYRKYVRSINPDCYLVGEIWWEVWPDSFINPRPYLQGDMLDAVMHYHQYKPSRNFFAKSEEYGGAELLKKQISDVFEGYPDYTKFATMNMSTSHDAPRLLSCFYNKGKYKFKQRPTEEKNTLTGKPNKETYQRVRNFLAFQFTMLGAPQIYAGDEMGMWGTDDPDNRKPLWWNDMKFEPETNNPFIPESKKEKIEISFDIKLNNYYKKIIKIRNENEELSLGSLKFLITDGDFLAYERIYNDQKIVVLINNQKSIYRLQNTLNIPGINLLNNQKIDKIKGLYPWEVVILKVKK